MDSMDNLENRSRSTLFLMEQLIVIAVFSFCAAVCVKTFVFSYLTVVDSKDKTGALLVAESCAESYKAVDGDLGKIALILGGTVSDEADTIVVYYDKKWQVCEESEAAYVLNLTNREAAENTAPPPSGDILVSTALGEEVVSFAVAARWEPHE